MTIWTATGVGVLVLPDFVEIVLGSFSCFNIEIAYQNFTFCGVWTPSLCALR